MSPPQLDDSTKGMIELTNHCQGNTTQVQQKDPAAPHPTLQRNQCVYCDHGVIFDPKVHEYNEKVPCNLGAFKDREYSVWRCNKCDSLHCLDVVDLDYYYSKYDFLPILEEEIPWFGRLAYWGLFNRFRDHGVEKHHKVLDYGCNRGYFILYLVKYCGFTDVHGFDPYSDKEKYRDVSELKKNAPYDYILLQDVLEHVESPNDLMEELSALLKPGGYLIVGTPNAAGIDLNNTSFEGYRNHLHMPYHLHIPTPDNVEQLGRKHGLVRVSFYSTMDMNLFLNERMILVAQNLLGGYLEILKDPIRPFDVVFFIFSPRFLFWLFFGYFFQLNGNMTNVFQKPIIPDSSDEKKNS